MTTTAVRAADRVKTRWLALLFLIAVFFPYIRVLPLGSDVQPLALIIGIVIVLASGTGRFPRAILPLLIVMLSALLIACVTGVNGVAVRGLANYFSLYIIAFATYLALDLNDGMPRKFIAGVVIIWFVVGLVQSLVWRGFMTQLLSHARTTDTRGVVGLAPEPTSYGIHCLMLLILASELYQGRKRNLLVAAILIQIILFARSSMAILFLVIWGIIWLATHYSLRRVLITTVACLVAGALIVPALLQLSTKVSGVRPLALFHLIATSPGLILVRDQSVSDRVAAITFSFIGAFQNFLLPHGFTAWSAYVNEIGPRMARYIPFYTAGDRIMSGYGAALYELGFIGLLVPLVVTHSAWGYYRSDRRRFITIAAVLNLLLLTAIPLAYPPIAFLIGYFCYYANRGPNARLPFPGDGSVTLVPARTP